MNLETETVPCELCGVPTQMLGTKRCNRCWELENRIRDNPDIAEHILQREKKRDDADIHSKAWIRMKTQFLIDLRASGLINERGNLSIANHSVIDFLVVWRESIEALYHQHDRTIDSIADEESTRDAHPPF